jgi:hypothetical protein
MAIFLYSEPTEYTYKGKTRASYKETGAAFECDRCHDKVDVRAEGIPDLLERTKEQLHELGWELLEGVDDNGNTVEWDVCKSCLEKEEEERREIAEEQAQKYGAAPAPEED